MSTYSVMIAHHRCAAPGPQIHGITYSVKQNVAVHVCLDAHTVVRPACLREGAPAGAELDFRSHPISKVLVSPDTETSVDQQCLVRICKASVKVIEAPSRSSSGPRARVFVWPDAHACEASPFESRTVDWRRTHQDLLLRQQDIKAVISCSERCNPTSRGAHTAQPGAS